jgi:hypothetical protein
MPKAPALGLLVAIACTAARVPAVFAAESLAGLEENARPVAFALCAFEGDGAAQKCAALGPPPTYQVPGNKRLIIEQVSGTCTDNQQPGRKAAVLRIVTGGNAVEHMFAGQAEPGSFTVFVSGLTRLYADPGTAIVIDLTSIPADDDNRLCLLSFSGQLIPRKL